MNKFIFFVFCFFTTKLSFSQSNEITPKEVAIYSSIIPGSGQFINKKFWKIPIIYTCIGTCIYFASDNNKKYKTYKDEFLNKYGVKLGFMSFFVKACVVALKNFPTVNAEIDGDEIIYKNYYNISFAVGTLSLIHI